MASYYSVPKNYAGKTFSEIRGETNGTFRPDVLESMLGIAPNARLTEGQNFQFDPTDTGSGEVQFLTKNFGAGQSPTDTLLAGQTAKTNDFLGRWRTGLNDFTTSTENELGLPTLRQNAYNLGSSLEAIPAAQKALAKQVGISAPNLTRRIASEQAELAPEVSKAIGQQQFAETEFGRRLNTYTQPFETEASMISDALAREVSLYSQDKQSELTLLLNKLQNKQQLTMAEQQRAQQLADNEAEFERQKQLYSFQTNEAIRKSNATKTASSGGASDWE